MFTVPPGSELNMQHFTFSKERIFNEPSEFEILRHAKPPQKVRNTSHRIRAEKWIKIERYNLWRELLLKWPFVLEFLYDLMFVSSKFQLDILFAEVWILIPVLYQCCQPSSSVRRLQEILGNLNVSWTFRILLDMKFGRVYSNLWSRLLNFLIKFPEFSGKRSVTKCSLLKYYVLLIWKFRRECLQVIQLR